MNFETDTSSKLPTSLIQDSSVNSPIFSVKWIHTIWKIIKMYLFTAVICNVRNGNTIIKLVMGISSASYFSVVYTGLFKIIVGIQLSSGNSAPNSGNNHNLTIPIEGGMHTVSRERVRVCVCVYPGTEGTYQNRHWNHHRWHATNSLERARLSRWCLQNHKRCAYRAPVRYVTKTWSVVLLN